MLKFSSLQDFLINKLHRNVTQTEIAKALDLDKSSVSLRIKKDSFLNENHKQKIEEYFGISLDDEAMSYDYSPKYIDAKLFDEIYGSCGNGVFVQSQNYEKVKIPLYILPKYKKNKEYSIIKARGDSMSGTIEDGDKLLIESFDTSEQIIDNQIYVFCYNNELFIKRLIKNIDQIIVKSDNREIPCRYIEGNNLDGFYIQGKVVGLVRSYFKESEL